ncbi:nuclear transcription factor Y subunit B-8-like [Ananas comosus]|uniref:Nuclear transcription factor Y subunit B-8-like n=1 Tax=Ananas comosus TaxID=4615 RepID=A0A6P5F0I7_ANACO|nr:nuclear transcription factor Y subunit B-8-like [Ananas comosus]
MKKALPANAKISKDAKETVQECVSEFISFVTGEASDKCQREKRKTINGDDLLWAMSTLGFEDYVEPLKVYLHKFREIEGERQGTASASASASAAQSHQLSPNEANVGGGYGGGGMFAGSGMMMMGQQHLYGSNPGALYHQHHDHQFNHLMGMSMDHGKSTPRGSGGGGGGGGGFGGGSSGSSGSNIGRQGGV